ncbi:MAG TPA: hypothetical protein DDW87_02750, partial [Firmicutes bacterium]|nr:hypothetical protein [Bacillota bacterium]
MRKSIVVTLLLLMAATLFVGAVYAFNAEGYPIVDEPITLEIMGRRSPVQPHRGDMGFFKVMEEKTNIKF